MGGQVDQNFSGRRRPAFYRGAKLSFTKGSLCVRLASLNNDVGASGRGSVVLDVYFLGAQELCTDGVAQAATLFVVGRVRWQHCERRQEVGATCAAEGMREALLVVVAWPFGRYWVAARQGWAALGASGSSRA